jgi:hypothetical protein
MSVVLVPRADWRIEDVDDAEVPSRSYRWIETAVSFSNLTAKLFEEKVGLT